MADWALRSPEGSLGVSVDQPQGCGQPGDHITLDAHLLQELDPNDLHTLGEPHVLFVLVYSVESIVVPGFSPKIKCNS